MSKELDLIIQETIDKYYFAVRVQGIRSKKAERLLRIVIDLVELKKNNNDYIPSNFKEFVDEERE
ncbi:hypothetical protein GCM10008967_15170 [Bacillus carboniphilus]|uniref:Uncharacterized protein n=1 Tax=Bacillus carboniphilus TaxID=86663 RepID=A0ABN0W565_9BACI